MSKTLKPIIENYNVSEEFFYNGTYKFIKGYATAFNMTYTLKALPLARRVHDGQYRHGTITVKLPNDTVIESRLPYVYHVLKVASTLISLPLPFKDKADKSELDTLIACALLHDTIEDAPDGFFKNDGYELVTSYLIEVTTLKTYTI